MSVAYPMAATRGIDPEAVSVPSAPNMVKLPGFLGRGSDLALVVLRNSGGKPVRLHAELMAEGSSRYQGSMLWHELAIYRAEDGAVAVAVRFMAASGTEAGVHRALLFDTADAAANWLETFDPAFDLSADFDVSDTRVSVAAVALKAASLRDRAERLTREYRVLVGEVLFRLETEI